MPAHLTASDTEGMKRVCRLVAETLEQVASHISAGMTTKAIEEIVCDFTMARGGRPAPLGYLGYPAAICASVNSCYCHGLPDDIPLRDGDIVNIDVTTELDGYFGDASRTFLIGAGSPRVRRLLAVAEGARDAGIAVIGPGVAIGDIGHAISAYVADAGFHVFREMDGHGIGKAFHIEPYIPPYGNPGQGVRLEPWQCITVEPLVSDQPIDWERVAIPNSGISIYRSKSHALSAQFEHTVLVTPEGHEVLTRSPTSTI
jgi:methionyl aminopeptidase